MTGQLITIEGIDGSGKSTQIRLLCEYLNSKGIQVLITHEPGGTEIGEQIRGIILDPVNTEMTALTEVFLYAAARAQHLDEVILPAMKAGRMVICSRFFDSTIAYQGYGAGFDLEVLAEINRITVGSLMPDLTIVYDLDPDKGLDRVAKRVGNSDSPSDTTDRMEKKENSFHQRVRKGFLAIANQNAHRMKVVDASGSEAEIFAETQKIIDDFLLRIESQEEVK